MRDGCWGWGSEGVVNLLNGYDDVGMAVDVEETSISEE